MPTSLRVSILLACCMCALLVACGQQHASDSSNLGDSEDAELRYQGGVTFERWSGGYLAVKAMLMDDPTFGQPPSATGTDGGAPLPACGVDGTQQGDCCYFAPIDVDDPAVKSAPHLGFSSAGPIAIQVGKHSLGELRWIENAGKQTKIPTSAGYTTLDTQTNPKLTWNPGDVLSAKADGDDVDGFERSVKAVSAIELLTPTLPLNSTDDFKNDYHLDKDHDLVVSWTPDEVTGSNILVSMNGSGAKDSHGTITCQVDDAAGTLTVPRELLQQFETGDKGGLIVQRTLSSERTQHGNATLGVSSTASLATYMDIVSSASSASASQ